MKRVSLRSSFPQETEKRKKTFRVTLRVSISIEFLSFFLGKNPPKHTRQKKKTNEEADEKNEEY